MALPSGTTSPTPKGAFLRVLGLGFGIAVSLGNCIGSGIMRTPSEIAARLPSVALIMCAWIVGALYSLAGAWSLSEVGAMIPSAGAYYTVARRAFGDYVSFVVGWTDCVSLCGAMATITILAGEYLGDLVPRFVTPGVLAAAWMIIPQPARTFSPDAADRIVRTGDMTVPRFGHTATLLRNGKVLIAGGMSGNGIFLASAELYDFSKGQFIAAGNPQVTRGYGSTATLLPSGKVLIAGGYNGSSCNRTAELYDPATNTFTLTGSMAAPRCSAIAVLLQNGHVLITGGDQSRGDRDPAASAEIYDPSTGRFTLTGSMRTPRDYFAAVVMRDGRVLVAGGSSEGQHPDTKVEATAEVYDPRTGRFSPTGNMTTPRDKFGMALLPGGKVFIVGGQADSPFGQSLSSTDIYDSASGHFSPGPSMQFRRFKLPYGVVALPNGEILVAGGANRPELYDSASNSFRPTTGTELDRFYFSTATVLPTGEVLLAGGYGGRGAEGAPNHAWLYQL